MMEQHCHTSASTISNDFQGENKNAYAVYAFLAAFVSIYCVIISLVAINQGFLNCNILTVVYKS